MIKQLHSNLFPINRKILERNGIILIFALEIPHSDTCVKNDIAEELKN